MPADFIANSTNEAFKARYYAQLFNLLLSPSQARCSPARMLLSSSLLFTHLSSEEEGESGAAM